jgi:hypothetical protein
LLLGFLDKAKSFNAAVEPVKVLRSNTFRIANANVLVRTASDLGRKYFFGLNYINAEEIYNLDNSYVAFICGSLKKIVFMPAEMLMKALPQISHDRNGEYKINISRDLNVALRGRGNILDCSNFVNNWDLILKLQSSGSSLASADESYHHVIQGRLIEIGNIRGYETFCPNKSKTFNKRRLDEIARISACPRLEFAEYGSIRNIDVMWFRKVSNGFYPECAFEVELSTGVWSGFGRLAALREYNTKLYIVSNNDRKFRQVSSSFPDLQNRCVNIIPDKIGLLYSAEINLIKLREEFNL